MTKRRKKVIPKKKKKKNTKARRNKERLDAHIVPLLSLSMGFEVSTANPNYYLIYRGEQVIKYYWNSDTLHYKGRRIRYGMSYLTAIVRSVEKNFK